MKKIVFATNNPHKLSEIKEILRGKAEILSLADIGCQADIPETADTLEGNALIKARYVAQNYKMDCFADDTGLEVDALGGAPGVHTARFAGGTCDANANTDKLLSSLEGEENRKAKFRTVIALIENGKENLFSGSVEGYILKERRGERGFGYDPVFSPEELGKSFAELGEEIKNKISHRARAVASLLEFLEK